MTISVKRSLRQIRLMEYGFGPDVMRLTKVCPDCGRGNSADLASCSDCGAALPEKTLLDIYRSRHPCCPRCGNAVRRAAVFCPDCGTRLRQTRAAV